MNCQLQHPCGHAEVHSVSDVPELLALVAAPCSECRNASRLDAPEAAAPEQTLPSPAVGVYKGTAEDRARVEAEAPAKRSKGGK